MVQNESNFNGSVKKMVGTTMSERTKIKVDCYSCKYQYIATRKKNSKTKVEKDSVHSERIATHPFWERILGPNPFGGCGKPDTDLVTYAETLTWIGVCPNCSRETRLFSKRTGKEFQRKEVHESWY